MTENSSGSVTNSHSGNRNIFTAEEAIGQNVTKKKNTRLSIMVVSMQ